jgi:hypothetical protein
LTGSTGVDSLSPLPGADMAGNAVARIIDAAIGAALRIMRDTP